MKRNLKTKKNNQFTILNTLVFLFLLSCKKKENVPQDASKFNSITSPNEFREAYANAIIRDLEKNGQSSVYHPDSNERLDFENTNVFVIDDDDELLVGYVRSPLGPSIVYSMKYEKWRSED